VTVEEEAASGVDVSVLADLGPSELRTVLPGFLASFVADPARAASNRARMAELVAGWSDEACRSVLSSLSRVGREHRVYDANPTCRDLSRQWSRDAVLEPVLEGVEHLRAAAARGPTIVVCNHLSYIDTTATDAVLAWHGHADLADRLVAAAGPKVYADLFRLIAASCLNTLPVPQSTSLSHTAKLGARELARKAHESLESTREALERGYVLLLYPEGSRSRSGRLGPFLKGTRRYLTCIEGAAVVPMAISGTDRLMPVGEPKLHPGPVAVRIAPALSAGPDGSARDLLEAAHAAVAALLPEALRPPPDAPATS
jgi:1-acyl-sn-glycerol-3-phosphate acyltransferase